MKCTTVYMIWAIWLGLQSVYYIILLSSTMLPFPYYWAAALSQIFCSTRCLLEGVNIMSETYEQILFCLGLLV